MIVGPIILGLEQCIRVYEFSVSFLIMSGDGNRRRSRRLQIRRGIVVYVFENIRSENNERMEQLLDGPANETILNGSDI